MNMDIIKLQGKHFSALKQKYQVHQYKDQALDDFLYLILRKAELGIRIMPLECQYLEEMGLSSTLEIITLQQYQADDLKRLESEFLELRSKYLVPEDATFSLDSPVYAILYKVEAGGTLTSSELRILDRYQLTDTINFIREISTFSGLKLKYKATAHVNRSPTDPLYPILQKLDKQEPLSDTETDWLIEHDLDETLEIYLKQEEERQAKGEFLDLKARYNVSFPDSSISCPLYPILKKLEKEEELQDSERNWLEKQQLTALLKIDLERKSKRLFTELKDKYQARKYLVSDPSDRLFSILKLMAESESITERDISCLIDRELLETAEIAKKIHFNILKRKYRLIGQVAFEQLYEIMLKLEREERLDPKQVVQLITEGHLSPNGEIARAYYRLEAIFYEKEYQRTGNKRNLASASSNWRKADKPENALQVTNSVNLNKIKEPDLKSALAVTRGAAFRDLGQLESA